MTMSLHSEVELLTLSPSPPQADARKTTHTETPIEKSRERTVYEFSVVWPVLYISGLGGAWVMLSSLGGFMLPLAWIRTVSNLPRASNEHISTENTT